ncbi:MAG: DUF6316 family protein [Gammaproteobacteria bacterium]|jgi:hypothetical protein
MTQHRAGETGAIPFRSGRIFNVGTQWYFATREGIDQGPFEARNDAEMELRLYVRNKVTEDQHLMAD